MRNTPSTRAASNLVLLAAALAAASGCQRASVPPDQAAWARAALERNATLQVVATDPATGAFTVRIKSTGEVRTVHVDELVGSLPVGAGTEATPASPATEAAQNSPSAATPAAPPPAPASAESSPPASPPSAGAAPPPGTGADVSGGPGPDQPAKPPVPQVAAAPGDRLLRSGPGYSISASGPATAAAGTAAATDAAAPALVRRHDPIICQGARPMRIDNQNLAFDGDGVSAEDGCELLITNSHISARGVGVQARNASVHIANSQIEGDPSAIDASADAQVYARFSTFRGTIHHNDNAAFHDLGGNVGD